MTTEKKNNIKASIAIPFVVIALFFSIMIWQKYRASREIPTPPPQSTGEVGRQVRLFFAFEGTSLARESRDIEACSTDVACLKSTLDELLNGPLGELDDSLPEGAAINGVKIEGALATVDFNQAFVESMLPGSSSEMMAVYSVVNTVAANFPAVTQVLITVDGKRGSLLRHVDLSEPLLPDPTLEKTDPQVMSPARK